MTDYHMQLGPHEAMTRVSGHFGPYVGPNRVRRSRATSQGLAAGIRVLSPISDGQGCSNNDGGTASGSFPDVNINNYHNHNHNHNVHINSFTN